MDSSKGVATLIEAMQRMWPSQPRARLLLAGGGMDRDPASQNAISRALSNLSDADRARVIVTGRFADAERASIYDALDVFAMPSAAESFGIAYLEAWICGKAVIGSRLASTQCVIDDGVDGVLVSPRDPVELAAALSRLLADATIRAQMARAGHAKTMARYTWEKITDKMEQIYSLARSGRLNGLPTSSNS